MWKLVILVILFGLVGCSSVHPEYVAKANSYTRPTFTRQIHGESISLVYTYSVESLESVYRGMFCGRLSNCDENIENVRNTRIFGGFNLSNKPIKNNSYKIESINLYRILYTTTGQLGESELVSGGVYYPVMPNAKPKGVILFFHPTFFAKSSVSSYDPQGKLNSSVAALFASDGYIVISPDYIGMGYNKQQVHPYVIYPQVNAVDGLAMLGAFKQFESDITNSSLSEEVMPLYLTGYSEGSAYALWFSRLYQEDQEFALEANKLGYQLRMVIPISGAYNLSSVTYDYLYSNNNTFNSGVYKTSNSLISGGLKPSLLTLALVGFAHYSESDAYSKVFNLDFYNMDCSLQFSSSCEVSGRKLNLLNLLAMESQEVKFSVADNALDLYMVNKINNAAKYKRNNGGMYTVFTNSVAPLVSESFFSNDSKLRTLLKSGDIYYWKSTIPTVLLTLNRDSVVSPLNSEYAFKGMSSSGSTNVELVSLDNSLIKNKLLFGFPAFEIDHLTGFTYLFIVARNQFDKDQTGKKVKLEKE